MSKSLYLFIIWLVVVVSSAAAAVALHMATVYGVERVHAVGGEADARAIEGELAVLSGQWAEEGGSGFVEEILAREERSAGSSYVCSLRVPEGLHLLNTEPLNVVVSVNGTRLSEALASGAYHGMYDLYSLSDAYGICLLEATFTGARAHGGNSALLVGTWPALLAYDQARSLFDGVCVGICAVSGAYALALWFSKRTEMYLPALAGLFVACLLNTLLNSHNVQLTALFWSGSVSAVSYVLRSATHVVSCLLRMELYVRLWGKCPRWGTVLLVSVAGTALYLLGKAGAVGIDAANVAVCLPYAAEVAVLMWWCAADSPGARVLAPFCVADVVICAWPQIVAAAGAAQIDDAVVQLVKYSMVLYAVVIFVLIARRFGGKFAQADTLADELARFNSKLEQTVRDRTGQLEESLEREVRSQERRRLFMNGIIHNLRSSLFVASGSVELMRMARDEATMRRRSDEVASGINRIAEAVDKLFLYTKLQDAAVTYSKTDFDARVLVCDLLEKRRPELEARGIGLELSGEEAFASADSFYISQAVDCLVDNAVRYTQDGGNIEVRIEQRAGSCAIIVSNTGDGIPDEDIPRVFDEYSRGSNNHRRDSTGLGLAICKRIVEDQGGTVSCSSVPGALTTFAVLLPYDEDQP